MVYYDHTVGLNEATSKKYIYDETSMISRKINEVCKSIKYHFKG